MRRRSTPRPTQWTPPPPPDDGEWTTDGKGWNMRAGRFRLWVGRHIYFPEGWSGSCYGLWPDPIRLKAPDPEGAMSEFVSMVRAEVVCISAALDEVTS